MAEDEVLTTSERARLWRRRRGLTQVEAGAELGVTRVRVIMLEGGAVEQLSPAEEEAVQTVEERLDELPAHDRCLVMRRRCGRLQREVAADLGRSLQHIRDMEAGRTPADELVGYWEC